MTYMCTCDLNGSIDRTRSSRLISEYSRTRDKTSRSSLMSIVRIRRPAIVAIVGGARDDEYGRTEKAPLRHGRGFATVSAFIKREETPVRAWDEGRGAIENRLTRVHGFAMSLFRVTRNVVSGRVGRFIAFRAASSAKNVRLQKVASVSRSRERAK